MAVPPLAIALLEALKEPALLVAGQRTQAANEAATALLGRQIVGQDIRFAIRQPHALSAILTGRTAQMEVLGIGGMDRSWLVEIDRLSPELLLIRLTDRSAVRATEKSQVDFVANASHELRTPLAVVLGYAETLAEADDLDDDIRRRFGQQIHDQAGRMLSIIRDLMSLSRIEADRYVEPRDLIAFDTLVRESVASAQPVADQRGCEVRLTIDPDLSPLRGDPAQLRQLVDNLLFNALRYGCREAGEHVEVGLAAHNRWHRLTVRDHGAGIDSQHLPRLTERFYRVDDARSRDSGGTGLGLAIVKQVVERHRGLLEIRSRKGEGTEVDVLLPQA